MTRRLAAFTTPFAFVVCVAFLAVSTDAFADDPDPWISRDKAFHFDVSAGMAAVGYGASAAWWVDARWKADAATPTPLKPSGLALRF